MSARLRSSTRASTAASESLAETMSEVKSKTTTSRKTTSSTSRTKRQEIEVLLVRALQLSLLTLTVLAATFYAVINDKIRFYPESIKLESLRGFNSRAEYSLRYQTLLYAWLVFNTVLVGLLRIKRNALNPLEASTEKNVQAEKCILTNSFEQILMSSFLQFGFVSFADPVHTLKLIPAINVVQFIGRILFYLGYPRYRSSGFIMTILPNTALICYNLYKFGSYLSLY